MQTNIQTQISTSQNPKKTCIFSLVQIFSKLPTIQHDTPGFMGSLTTPTLAVGKTPLLVTKITH